MWKTNSPYVPPLESEVSQARQFPRIYSTLRMVLYSLVTLLGFTILFTLSGVLDHLYSISMEFPFRRFGSLARLVGFIVGFYLMIFSRQFVLCTKADRAVMRELSQTSRRRSLRNAIYSKYGCVVTLAAIFGGFVFLYVYIFFLDWNSPTVVMKKWSASADDSMMGVACYSLLFTGVMCCWQVLHDWRLWYLQRRKAKPDAAVESGVVEDGQGNPGEDRSWSGS